MVRHEQPGDDLALDHVPFHDFRDIGFIADPVPDSFRIDDHAGTQVAMVEAPGFVRAHQPFQVQAFGFALEMGVKLF